MTYSEFRGLSENEKRDCLWNKGKPVGKYQDLDARFILYQVAGFYVEAEYRNDFNEIVSLKAFETADLPQHYLDSLNISGLNH